MKEEGPILLKVKEAVKYTGIGRNRLLEMAKMKRISCNNFPGRNIVYKS